MEERSHAKKTELTYYKGACEIHLTLHYDDAYSAVVDADAIHIAMGNRGAFHVNFGDKLSERSPDWPKLVNPKS